MHMVLASGIGYAPGTLLHAACGGRFGERTASIARPSGRVQCATRPRRGYAVCARRAAQQTARWPAHVRQLHTCSRHQGLFSPHTHPTQLEMAPKTKVPTRIIQGAREVPLGAVSAIKTLVFFSFLMVTVPTVSYLSVAFGYLDREWGLWQKTFCWDDLTNINGVLADNPTCFSFPQPSSSTPSEFPLQRVVPSLAPSPLCLA